MYFIDIKHLQHDFINVFESIIHESVKKKQTQQQRFESKIEKVPRGIQGEKSSKDMARSRNLVSTIGA